MTTVLAYRNGVQGKRADGVMIYTTVPQGDGHRYQWTNCGPASECERLISQMQGKLPPRNRHLWPPTPSLIRNATGDTSGGTTPGQTTSASERLFGIPHAPPRIGTFAEVEALLWAGYSVDLLVDYSAIDAYRSGSPGFGGNHRSTAMGISGISRTDPNRRIYWSDTLYCGRRSGIPRGAQWLPASVIRRAAGQLVVDGEPLDAYMNRPGSAYFIQSLTRYSPVTPPPPVPPTNTAPSSGSEDSMIHGVSGVLTTKVVRLTAGQEFHEKPLSTSKVITRLVRSGPVGWVGFAGQWWQLVIVGTAAPYKDGKVRPTGLYIPRSAGQPEDRTA